MTSSIEETQADSRVGAASSTDISESKLKVEHEHEHEPQAESEIGEECLLTKAELLYKDDKVFEAARILKSIQDPIFKDIHRLILEKADDGEKLASSLKANPEDGDWIDQGVSKGKFPTRILYRLETNDEGTSELTARCETPIDRDLLNPLLAVLNETQLYQTWMPTFKVPKFGLTKSEKLKQIGRVSQLIFIDFDVPWPFAKRELIMSATAIDDTSNGNIVLAMKTLETGDDETIPEKAEKSVRVDVDGGFLMRKCPSDHPSLQFMEGGTNDDLVLVTFSAKLNPNMKYLPQSFLNFLVKTALGMSWKMMLQLAQDVKDGKRPDHTKAIEEKDEELYGWVRARVEEMLGLISERETLQV